MWSLPQPEAKLLRDRIVRFEDALAAAETILEHVVTTTFVESQMDKLRPKSAVRPEPEVRDGEDGSDFSVVVTACRRFLDYVGGRTDTQSTLSEVGLLTEFKGTSPLKKLRSGAFDGMGTRPQAYGGFSGFTQYRLAGPWKEMIAEMGRLHLLEPFGDAGFAVRRGAQLGAEAAGTLRSWRLLPATGIWLQLAEVGDAA